LSALARATPEHISVLALSRASALSERVNRHSPALRGARPHRGLHVAAMLSDVRRAREQPRAKQGAERRRARAGQGRGFRPRLRRAPCSSILLTSVLSSAPPTLTRSARRCERPDCLAGRVRRITWRSYTRSTELGHRCNRSRLQLVQLVRQRPGAAWCVFVMRRLVRLLIRLAAARTLEHLSGSEA
jgi:hypothetical protein